ncbi:MAG: HDOD domain-containing protein [Planctomycetota bacterium]
MAVAAEQRANVVSGAIREISHIATLPEITLKIVELVEDPKSTAQDLHKVISSDPALSTRILKVVNSSFYGLPGQIASINRAIVMLGLNAVKNIAIAASLAKLFRGGELTGNFSAKDLWTHANATAVCSKMLADSLKLGLSDEAFLAGLMHDIGIMVEMQFDRNKLTEVFEKLQAGATDMLALEEATFGANHQDFGAGLCERWKFPKSFAAVTGFHHRPLELAQGSRTLVCLVHIADRIAAEVAGGFRQDLANFDIEPAVRDEIKLTVEKLAEVKKALPEQLKNAANMLG